MGRFGRETERRSVRCALGVVDPVLAPAPGGFNAENDDGGGPFIVAPALITRCKELLNADPTEGISNVGT